MPRPKGSKNKVKKTSGVSKLQNLMKDHGKLEKKLFNPLNASEEIVEISGAPSDDLGTNTPQRNAKGHFAPGNRLQGLKSVSSRIRQELGEAKCKKVLDLLWDAACEGKMEALIFLADRLYPNREPIRTYIEYQFGPLETISDLDKEVERVCHAMGEGKIQLEAGERIIEMLDKKRKFIYEGKVQVLMDSLKVQVQSHSDIENHKVYSVFQ